MKKLCVSFFCLMLAISMIGCGQKDFDDDYVVAQYEKEKEKEEQKRIKEQEEEAEKLRKEQEKKEKEEEKKAQEEEKERQKQEEKERKESEKAEKEEQKKAEEEQKKLEKEQKKSEKEEIKKAEQEEKEKKKAEQEEIKKAEQEEKDKKKSEKEETTSTSTSASVSEEEPEPDQDPQQIIDDFLAGWNGNLDEEIPRYVMRAAYSSVIERVYGVITGKTSGERSDAGVSEACLGKSQADNLSSIGYALVNLDGDTLLEMVIIIPGSGFGQTYKVVEVYSLDNTLSPVLDGHASSRSDIDVYAKYPKFDSKISNLEITYFNDYK